MASPSERFDDLIAKTPDWRGAIFAKLHSITHEADPEIVEEVKCGRPSNPMDAILRAQWNCLHREHPQKKASK